MNKPVFHVPRKTTSKTGERNATNADLSLISNQITKLSKNPQSKSDKVLIVDIAQSLGLNLKQEQFPLVRQLALDRLTQQQRKKQLELEQKKEEILREAIGPCPDCNSTKEILPEYDIELNLIKFAFCELCGRVFFKSVIRVLNERIKGGEFRAPSPYYEE